MDFIRSHFEKMNFWSVEHFFITKGYLYYYRYPFVMKKNVLLVRGASFRTDFLQNPYFTRPWEKKSFCHVEKHKQWKSMPKDWVAENLTKCKNVLLLRLVRFFATQTLLTLCTYVAYSWSMKPALLFFWNWTQLTK